MREKEGRTEAINLEQFHIKKDTNSKIIGKGQTTPYASTVHEDITYYIKERIINISINMSNDYENRQCFIFFDTHKLRKPDRYLSHFIKFQQIRKTFLKD